MKADPSERATALELMDSKWMIQLQEALVQDIVEKEHGDDSDIHKIAKNSLRALMHFNSNVTTKYQNLTAEERKKLVMKEASLAMIAHLLLDQKHKSTLKKIFKIMDSSGDGQLEADELRTGFTRIFNDKTDMDNFGTMKLYEKKWSDEELN